MEHELLGTLRPSSHLHIVGDLVQGHPIHLDGRRPLLLLEVDVAHVHTEPAAEGILLILHDLGVDRQGLVVVVVRLVLNGQVQAHGVGEVDVQLIEQVLLLPQSAELSLLRSFGWRTLRETAQNIWEDRRKDRKMSNTPSCQLPCPSLRPPSLACR